MRVKLLSSVAGTILLSACGGGGGNVTSTPPPPPITTAPAPGPTPAPSPTASTFNTPEYRNSPGVIQANAITAYQAGATGAGITVGVVDSGVDAGSPEFVGKIAPGSIDLVANRGLQDDGGHGTAVSSVLLGAKNDRGTHGMAFDATLLVLRTDSVGSCTDTTGEDSGCTHSDSAMARAIDRAVTERARVINISLGGSSGGPAFRAAIGRATTAGLIVVISAGNDSATEADPLALIANDPIARGQVIIAGAVDGNRQIADFSNRAGVSAANYLAALGVSVPAPDETGRLLGWSGTSFSAPQIAGAAALLAQAFPNLTARGIVELLYAAALDAGATGTDTIYGRGVLDVGRAFRPVGAASLAGGATAVSLTDNGALSAPMGDAGGAQGMGAVILDGFARAFAVELAGTIAAARPHAVLGAALAPGYRSLAASGDAITVALQIRQAPGGAAIDPLTLAPIDASRARATAGMVASRIGRDTRFAIGISHSGAGLAAGLEGRREPAFLVARDGARELGFDRTANEAVAVRHEIGRLSLWTSAEAGDALTAAGDGFRGFKRPYGYAAIAAGIDRSFGPVRASASVTHLIEDETVLGARFGPLFGANGARSWFADLGLETEIGGGWRLGAGLRQGWTRVGAGGARADGTTIRTNAWRLDLGADWIATAEDRLGFRLSQPLRVASGAFDLILPTGYDYATGVTAMGKTPFALTPTGREIAFEAAYGLPLLGGRVDANLFWRRDPGNIAWLPDDRGGAVRFSRGF